MSLIASLVHPAPAGAAPLASRLLAALDDACSLVHVDSNQSATPRDGCRRRRGSELVDLTATTASGRIRPQRPDMLAALQGGPRDGGDERGEATQHEHHGCCPHESAGLV